MNWNDCGCSMSADFQAAKDCKYIDLALNGEGERTEIPRSEYSAPYNDEEETCVTQLVFSGRTAKFFCEAFEESLVVD
jgi:hypothetical protein